MKTCAFLMMALPGLLVGSVSALADEAKKQAGAGVVLELNNAQQVAESCRLSFISKNALTTPIKDLGIEIVLFDKDGLVSRFMALTFGRLPVQKSRVRRFDLPKTQCANLSKILINDVKSCGGVPGGAQACLDSMTVSSRGAIKLGL